MTNVIRASERKTFKRCQAKWWWAYREGLVPRRERLGALWFGTGVHIALAEWYCGPGIKRGRHPAETWEEFSREALSYVRVADAADEEVAKYEEAGALGATMLNGYIERYGRDEHMHVIAPEQTFDLPIPWPHNELYVYDEGDIIAHHVGTFDLPFRDLRDDTLWIEEHKTAKAVETRHLALDDQGGTYWAVATAALRRAGLIGRRETLAGIEYNFLRKGNPDDRPRDAEGYATNKPTKGDYLDALVGRREVLPETSWTKAKLDELERIAKRHSLIVLGERSKIQPPPLFVRHKVHRTTRERRTMLERIQAEALQMRALRDGLFPITKTPERDCSWCQFYDMCELQERGGAWQDLKRLQFVARDPYADHRKSTEE